MSAVTAYEFSYETPERVIHGYLVLPCTTRQLSETHGNRLVSFTVFKGDLFDCVLYYITVKKFVKRLLFIFLGLFNSRYLRNIAENNCHNGGYDYFGNHIKSVIEYRVNY